MRTVVEWTNDYGHRFEVTQVASRNFLVWCDDYPMGAYQLDGTARLLRLLEQRDITFGPPEEHMDTIIQAVQR